MKTVRKIIKIDEELCNGCGQCVPDCAEGSLQIIDGKAKLVADKLCDGLGACLGSCPTGALKIIEREADDFDEEAVEEFLAGKGEFHQKSETVRRGSCPGSQSMSFPSAIPAMTSVPPTPAMNRGASAPAGDEVSALSHWPIQIRLAQPTAPWLQGAHLLIAADCSAVSAINFQRDYLQGKKVLMGCPKFDDAELYIERLAAIIDTAGLKKISILIMEVPCCSAMNTIVRMACERATTKVAVEQITLSRQGVELGRVDW